MATLLNKRTNFMTTKQLHFKWTISRGRDTYGYNICTLLVNGEKKGKCCGGGYDMQGTSFAQWLESDFQTELCLLFANDIKEIEANKEARSYTNKGIAIKHMPGTGFYGATVYQNTKNLSVRIGLDGACGFDSMKRIAEAIGIKLQWNPESDKYKNHSYYTAIIDQPQPITA